MKGFKRDHWNARYAASELVWGAEPNRFVAAAFESVEPSGRVLDLACGEGRNAIWLASRGFDVTAVDFSYVALERGRQLAARRGVEIRFIEADVSDWTPGEGAFDRVLVAYLQLPSAEMEEVWERAARALAPRGELFGIGHARRNLTEGVGGPKDADVLWSPEVIARRLELCDLEVVVAEEVERALPDEPHAAIDARILARHRVG